MANHSGSNQHHYVLYYYDPNLGAAIFFIILFALLTLAHAIQMVRFKMWFWLAFIIGSSMEAVGYIGRALSHYQPLVLGPFILQSILLLVAPALFAASIYMTLGRITVVLRCEHLAPIPKRWLTKTFVCGDVLAFFVQAAGAGIMAGNSANSLSLGQTIILVGLAIQILSFGLFVVVAWVFHRRVLALSPGRNNHPVVQLPWQKHLLVLYCGSGLILVRSVFRIVEYAMGNSGYIMRHEAFLYVFDATLMLGVVAVFLAVHPNELLGQTIKSKQRQEGSRMT
ncbi:MAG: hypothetical protein M1821_007250 [Bathelium mastoideum]|nr:MAG: hypothetical protein M1821_007250 [Bathelium mastoideum]